MEFQITSKVRVKEDSSGAVRQLDHPRQAYTVQSAAEAGLAEAAAGPVSRRALAEQYLREVTPHFRLDADMTSNLTESVSTSLQDEGSKIRFEKEKVVRDRATVTYVQTCLGLPVWEAGITVRMRGEPAEIIGSQSSVHQEIDAERPAPDAPYMPDAIDEPRLAELLGLASDRQQPTINSKRLIVYRYDAENRGACRPREGEGDPRTASPQLDLPPVHGAIQKGRHYVVVDVKFTLPCGGGDPVNWSAFVEPETGSVLYLRAFVSCLDAFVLEHDPLTSTGDTTIRPNSSTAVLDSVRDRVTLEGLTQPPDVDEAQHLVGEFVRITNISPPNVAPPTGSFLFSVPTNDFSAVNAYYHCDRLFRMMSEMGFEVESYFDGTTFPVRVDHRATINGSFNTVNATAPGNTAGNGSDGFRFALLQTGTSVGIAVDWRVVLHEFGHTILWDNVSWPNFRFAHSAGDSLAAILNDVESQAPDRGRTFPWTVIGRRHDRTPGAGWAWGGTRDDTLPVGHPSSHDRAGYDREQILSSTLFRLYRAIGGAHGDVEVRRFAARYVAFLVFDVVASITSVAQPQDAEDFAELLIGADESTIGFEGQAGGVVHKVIRWAFEQQGAYQRPGAPTPVFTPGAPPAVDVFIDDGRGGTYGPVDHFVMDSTELWVRQQADGEDEHQDPVESHPSSVYVRVGNRGTATARNVRVRLMQSQNSIDPTWPADWTPVADAFGADVAPGGEILCGPIAWTPAAAGEVGLLASVEADGDESNVDLVSSMVQTARLVHCDNNLAFRRVVVAEDSGGGGGPTTVTVGDQPELEIPDHPATGVESEVEVTSGGTVANLAVSVDIRHTFIGDLRVALVPPQGTRVLLHDRTGFATHDLIRTYASETSSALASLRGVSAAGRWRLEVSDHAGRDVGVLRSWELELVLEAPAPVVLRDSNPQLAIPDNNRDGVADTIDVAASGLLDTIAVSLEIRHTYIGDLRVELASPGGTTVRLHDMTGSGTHDLVKTCTRDNVPALASLQGEPLQGIWTLRVADRLGADIGTLVRWGLELQRAPAPL